MAVFAIAIRSYIYACRIILLGLAYMLAPGPVLVETVRRSIRGGTRSATAVQCGAMAANLSYAVLFMCGAGQALVFPGAKFGFGLVGAALLVFLAVSMAFDMRHLSQRLLAKPTYGGTIGFSQERLWQPFTAGLLLLLVNPYTLVFWFSVGITTFNASAGGLIGFLVGGGVGCAIAAFVAGQLGAARMRQFAPWIWVGCAIVLATLGVQLGYATLVTAHIWFAL